MPQEYENPIEYHAYCSHQTPEISPVDQFECGLTDSFCDRSRENVDSCPHLKKLHKIEDIVNFDEGPDQPGGRPGGSATLHFQS